jgi:hypothetical protein
VRDDVAAGFRDAVEKDLFNAYDPIKVARCKIAADRADAIDARNRAAVEAAYAAAMQSPATVIPQPPMTARASS